MLSEKVPISLLTTELLIPKGLSEASPSGKLLVSLSLSPPGHLPCALQALEVLSFTEHGPDSRPAVRLLPSPCGVRLQLGPVWRGSRSLVTQR